MITCLKDKGSVGRCQQSVVTRKRSNSVTLVGGVGDFTKMSPELSLEE